jgi:seryl-tRNA synthetase
VAHMIDKTDNPAAPQKSGKRQTLGKVLKVLGLLFLLYFMMDNLSQLSLMKAMDSKLAANEKMMEQAIAYQEGMHESEALTYTMADKMVEINAKMRQANELAADTNAIAGRITAINDELLAVNRQLNGIVLANIALTDIMLAQSGDMRAFMDRMNENMRVMNASAVRQVDLTRQLYELTRDSNAGTPALP